MSARASAPAYFLVAVSNRRNLELCVRYALAGFLNSHPGVWTFCEIQEGDFVSFLYGARAHNLYRVIGREALVGADTLPPWDPITFQESGRTYSFPFRLRLRPIRAFSESLVRSEFAYVAENLLMRGGYGRTHFQADQTTLQSVSQMGEVWTAEVERLHMPEHRTFVPLFTNRQASARPPAIYPLRETILQSAIRQHLGQPAHLAGLLELIGGRDVAWHGMEVLGERAVSEGHVDLLIKEAVPIGSAQKVIVEVKLRQASLRHLVQLRQYMNEFGAECVAGILIAERIPARVSAEARRMGIHAIRYRLDLDWSAPRRFEEIRDSVRLEPS